MQNAEIETARHGATSAGLLIQCHRLRYIFRDAAALFVGFAKIGAACHISAAARLLEQRCAAQRVLLNTITFEIQCTKGIAAPHFAAYARYIVKFYSAAGVFTNAVPIQVYGSQDCRSSRAYHHRMRADKMCWLGWDPLRRRGLRCTQCLASRSSAHNPRRMPG